MKPLEQHQVEIERNRQSRAVKPLIRRIYSEFYGRIVAQLNRSAAGAVIEIGSGSGELKSFVPEAVCTDLFANAWLDLVCDAYRLPFNAGAVSNLILLDVFHHLARPFAFLAEAQRVLARGGRLVIFEPYISAVSSLVYGVFHHEPVAWRRPIDRSIEAPVEQSYYAAQGNATRLFFGAGFSLPNGLRMVRNEAMSDFGYLLSGGLSKPALYPASFYGMIHSVDGALSVAPRIFGARCLIVLERQ